MKNPRLHQSLQGLIALEEQFPALVVFVRTVGARAERRADILQIVSNDAAAVLGDNGIERVAGLHVHQIGPCAEHFQRPQLAPVFVRDDVVGIVGTGAVVAKPAHGPSRQRAGRDRSVRPVGLVGAPEHGLEVAALHRPLLARQRREHRGVGDHEVAGLDRDEVVLDLPIAERPEDPVRHEQSRRWRPVDAPRRRTTRTTSRLARRGS